jgi:hypothetical protein
MSLFLCVLTFTLDLKSIFNAYLAFEVLLVELQSSILGSKPWIHNLFSQ